MPVSSTATLTPDVVVCGEQIGSEIGVVLNPSHACRHGVRGSLDVDVGRQEQDARIHRERVDSCRRELSCVPLQRSSILRRNHSSEGSLVVSRDRGDVHIASEDDDVAARRRRRRGGERRAHAEHAGESETEKPAARCAGEAPPPTRHAHASRSFLSSASRIVASSASLVNGLARKLVPGSNGPRALMTSSLYPGGVDDFELWAHRPRPLRKDATGHARHDDVREQNVDRPTVLAAHDEGVVGVAGYENGHAGALEHRACQLANHLLVLDKQDGAARVRAGDGRAEERRHRRTLRLELADRGRQVHGEHRPDARRRRDGDRAPGLGHDPVSGGQTEAGALPLLLGREERLEDAGAGRGIHPLTRIADGQLDVGPRRQTERPGALGSERDIGRLNREPAARRHRVARVDGEVHEYLLELPGVGSDGRDARLEQAVERDVLADQPLEKRFDVGDDGVEVEHARPKDLLAGKREQLLRQRAGPIGGTLDLAEMLGDRATFEACERELGVAG